MATSQINTAFNYINDDESIENKGFVNVNIFLYKKWKIIMYNN